MVSWLDVTGQLPPTHSHDHGNARERDENARACKGMREGEASKQEKIKERGREEGRREKVCVGERER